MGLDVAVRCDCFARGKTRPHPFPELLRVSKIYGPDLKPAATDEQVEQHDRWYERSCRHGGYAAGGFLGNAFFIARLRKEVAGIQRRTGKRFPILLKAVLYDGTHTGDYLPAGRAPALMQELRVLGRLRKDKATRDFVETLSCACRISIKTGNPLQF